VHTPHPLLRGLSTSSDIKGCTGMDDVAVGARLPNSVAARMLARMGENAAGPEFDSLVPLCAGLVAELRSVSHRTGDGAFPAKFIGCGGPITFLTFLSPAA